MFDGGESMPLAGEEKTTLSDAPEPPAFGTPGKINNNKKILSFCEGYFTPPKPTIRSHGIAEYSAQYVECYLSSKTITIQYSFCNR